MQVSKSDFVRCILSTLNYVSRNNRGFFTSPQSGVSKPSQESIFFFAEASSTFLWSRLSDHIGRKPVLMTASSRRIKVFVHDAKSYVLGYDRADNIHDRFRSLQDLQ